MHWSIMRWPFLTPVMILGAALAGPGCIEVTLGDEAGEGGDPTGEDAPYRTDEQQWNGPNFCAIDYRNGSNLHERTDLLFYHPDAGAVMRLETYAQGALTARQESERDPLRRLTALSTDEDGDGEVDHRVDFFYGTADRIIEEQTDLDGDGRVDEVLHREFYGADTRPGREEVDTDGDGLAERWRDFYDEGARLTITSGATDPNGDHRIVQIEFDPVFDIPLTIETDFDADGVVDEIETWDVQGQYVFGIDIDRDRDGVADWRMKRVFADDIGLTSESIDEDGDGTMDEIANFIYDCRPAEVAE